MKETIPFVLNLIPYNKMSGAKSMKRKASVEEEMDIVIKLNNLDLEWSELTVSLEDFAKSFTSPQPILICEGKYEEWGPNTEDNPDLYPLLFALHRRYIFRIEAQCMNFSPEKKYPIGPKFEIDDDFDGWFEIISEDGSPMFQIESVSDLATHPSKPFVLMKSMHVHRFRNGEWERCTLDIGYEMKVGSWMSDHIEVRGCGCGKLLQCKSFSGEDLYLPISEPGRFSLFGNDYLTGPQTFSSLCERKFPINVKLMEGSPRPTDFDGFVPTLVLHKVDFVKELTVWPVQKDVPLVHIPTNTPMKLKTLVNLKSLRELPVYDEIVHRINSFLPKSKRWYTHTQSSLARSLLQNTSTTTASRRRYTTRVQTATSATGISTTYNLGPMPLTSIDIHQPSTSGYFKTTSTDIHQPGSSGYSKATSTDIHQPSTSGYSKTTSTDIPSWFSTTTTTASSPLSPTTTNILRPSSNSSSPSTFTTYVEHSTSRHTSKPTTDIHQPSTSGLQSSFSALKKWTLKRISKESRSSMTITNKESDDKPHESNLADAHRKDKVGSVEKKSTETRADYQASGYSSVHSDMFCTLDVDSKSSGDDPRTQCSDASQEGKLHLKPIGGMDNQKTSGQAALEPSSDRPSSRFETLTQRDDGQTFDLSAARSFEARGDQPTTSRESRTSRIETRKRKGVQESYDYAVAELRKFRFELWDRINQQQKSGQGAVQPERFNFELLENIDNQQASSQAVVEPSRVRRFSGARRRYHIVDPMSPESPEGDEPPSTDPDDCVDPYDEIDEIYAENKRIYNERSDDIPLEMEIFL